MKRSARAALATVIGLSAALPALVLTSGPALATEMEPALVNAAWYWKEAKTEERTVAGRTVLVETTNPYCPTITSTGGQKAAEETCAEGRLPVEVRSGNYSQQNMISALQFDLTAVPVGATINEFEVVLLEADCDPNDQDKQDTPQCRSTTTPLPPDDPSTENVNETERYEIEACMVPEFFGAGEARPYSERPRVDCDVKVLGAREVRKAPKNKDGTPKYDDDHVWVFDMTTLARRWTRTFTPVTAVMLRIAEPRNAEEDDSVRFVFTGPRVREGVITYLSYSGGSSSSDPTYTPPTDTGGGTDPGFTSTGGSTTTTFPGTTGFTPPYPTAPTPVVAGTPVPGGQPSPTTEQASDQVEVEAMPGYVWLALLGGLIAFSLVRSVVIPATTGVRPDGVLAQITRMNSERRGGALQASGPGMAAVMLAGVRTAAGSVASGVKHAAGAAGSLKDKLPSLRRKG